MFGIFKEKRLFPTLLNAMHSIDSMER